MSRHSKKWFILTTFKELMTSPIDTYRHWGVISVVAVMFVFIPQLPPPNDWQRITAGLSDGLEIYSHSSRIYPPWGLFLLWPYYPMTAAGSRVASVLVMGWLCLQQRWTLVQLAAIIVSPFFMWSMMMSSLDVLGLLLPILLWEASEGRSWGWVGRTLSMVFLLIKPQGSLVIILYLVWKNRDRPRRLIPQLIGIGLTVVPISLIGEPPLIVQWLNNAVFNPSPRYLYFWSINNVSLTDHLGLIPGVMVIGAAGFG